MNNDLLISIIVPIYNIEDYLSKCLESIINQSYKETEIILIDDGSTDNSYLICKKYKLKDKRIKIVHKKHGGLSSARNLGLEMATGELISFVDGDDYLELDFYEKLKKNMDQYNSDISICNYYVDDNDKIRSTNINNANLFTFENEMKFLFINTSVAWNKLYKKKIFDSIRYPEGKFYEDIFIICHLLDKSNRISYEPLPLYHYVQRNNSIVHTFSINHFDKVDAINNNILFLYNKKCYDLALEEKNRMCYTIITNLIKMKLYHINNKEVYDKYYKELCDTVKSIKWKDSSKYVKRFKIAKNLYLYIRYTEYKIYYTIKKLLNRQ